MSFLEKVEHLQIPIRDIYSATSNFSEENFIASGGFGQVYHGKSDKHGMVAIKRLDPKHGQGDREFKMEIALLSVYKHENIVSLVGFCIKDEERILVYKHERNGSLDKYLPRKDLTWIQRLQICLDAARGLKYLHDDVGPQHRIVHRDIKSSNILLDENWRAKISDFGLSKVSPANVPHTFLITQVCGTIGYADPEYIKTEEFTKESDVYSFGVVLFEVLCGRPARVHGRQDLNTLAQDHYAKGTLRELIPSDFLKQIKTPSLSTFSKIAYECLGERRQDRPTMTQVVEVLQEALTYQRLSGIETRLQDFKSKLATEPSDGVRIIGIWGIGGGGKTALAYAAYTEMSVYFQGHCFLENIRESSSKHGLKMLQEDMLSSVLKTKVALQSVEDGRNMIKIRLCHKKVLVVLDDVDDLKQIEALAGSRDWFGEGSRIIITTRNKHVLITGKADLIYGVSLLSHDEAIELFCVQAFREGKPVDGYESLLEQVVSYAGGLPLALKVLGSFLYGTDKNEWKNILERLKHISDQRVMQSLQISYDGLDPGEKDLFLDIACFFRKVPIDDAMKVLAACNNLNPVTGVTVLVQKSLLYESNGVFDMHDLIQEMARNIVRRIDPDHPEKHSRVWISEEILDICSNLDTTTENDSIQALVWSNESYIQCLPQALPNMKNARWISLENYPKSLPTNFQPTMLGCLTLRHGLQEELWQGFKHLPNLKILDLQWSRSLKRTPDFSWLPRLESLNLRGCIELKEIHPSIGYHERLVYVNMESCKKLEMFPPIIRMHKLETLDLNCCFQLWKFPEFKSNMDSLKNLHLKDTSIETIPSLVREYCTNLVSLDLRNCHKLKRIECNFDLLKLMVFK